MYHLQLRNQNNIQKFHSFKIKKLIKTNMKKHLTMNLNQLKKNIQILFYHNLLSDIMKKQRKKNFLERWQITNTTMTTKKISIWFLLQEMCL